MTDGGGSWQAPRPGDPAPPQPPAPAPPAGSPPWGQQWGPPTAAAPPPGPYGPTGTAPLEPTATPPGRSRGKVIGAAVAVVALLAAGIFAITRFSGESAAGGADSPEAAGLDLLGALENEDVLGAIDVLLPGERETLRGPATDLSDELRRLEVLSDDANLSDVGGFDVTIEDESVDTEATNVDDIVNLRLSGTASAVVNGDDLPVGDLVLDESGADPSELDVDEAEPTDFEFPMTAVRDDGRWYVSLFYTAAELVRAESDGSDVPAEGITPTGGDSPEDAFDAFVSGVEQLDLETIIASLNPDEFAALQRYAPLFLDDAQAELDDADVELSIDDPEYDVSGSGDTRRVSITYLKGSLTADGESADVLWEDGCITVTPPPDEGEPFDSCALAQDAPSLEDMFGDDSEQVQQVVEDVQSAFSDYENPGIIVKQVDGRWFLSPMATGSEQVLAILRALDRDEIEQIGDDASDLIDEVFTGTVVDTTGFPDELTPDEPATDDTVPHPDTVPTDETFPDFSIPDFSIPASIPGNTVAEDSAAADECFAAETAADATACYQALIDTGEISPSVVPVYLRAPQCGLADLYWSGDWSSLPDAEFAAQATAAAPCFQALVADGTIDEFDLTPELSHPECLEGRNWYTVTDEDYIDRFLDCVYG